MASCLIFLSQHRLITFLLQHIPDILTDWKQGNWGWFWGSVSVLEGQKQSEAGVNPICHVLTVLIRGLCWEQPLYPIIPPEHTLPSLPFSACITGRLLHVRLVQLYRWKHNWGLKGFTPVCVATGPCTAVSRLFRHAYLWKPMKSWCGLSPLTSAGWLEQSPTNVGAPKKACRGGLKIKRDRQDDNN